MERKPNLWFMPWRWRRWTWALLLPLTLLAYFLSAVPMLRLTSYFAKNGNLKSDYPYVRLAYRPVWMIDANCKPVKAVVDWEDGLMDNILRDNEALREEGGWVQRIGVPSSQIVLYERLDYALSRVMRQRN
jgi:hypothetical protein